MPRSNQSSLRKQLRATRRQLPGSVQKRAAQSLRRVVARNLRFRKARHIAFYMAAEGELDPSPAMNDAAAAGKACYLPVMTDQLMRWRSAPLAFQRYDPFWQPLVRNRYGILEPPFFPRDLRKPEQLDIIVVPLVAFDREGNRVGMGQGFYDRTLAPLARRYRRPWLVGCGYSIQETSAVSPNPWDIPLDAVVTECGLLEMVAG